MGKNLAKIYSGELEGIEAKLIEVEVDINVGIHSFNIVGLADKALNEARERVGAAIKNSGIKPPNRENRKITVNLAPADIKKTGSQYDLAIALGYLAATEQIKHFESHDKLFLGELALDGRLRSINGALNIAQMAQTLGIKYIFLPKENANEASVIDAVEVIPVESLMDAILILEGQKTIQRILFKREDSKKITEGEGFEFADIKGQDNAKRAIMVAAAGGHNLLMVGPPGMGKSFLAGAMAGILPDLNIDEAIEVTKIWSAAGLCPNKLIDQRPFRSPHATASMVALIGGGQDPKPGEISLAHRGVLFLDELPEFQKHALESLRQPLETGLVHIARAKSSIIFPAKFSLIAAMNPCPCGYYGDKEKECSCSAYEIIKYQKKISGPLLDRIDIQIKVGRVKIDELKNKSNTSDTVSMKSVVQKAQEKQQKRFMERKIKKNAEMTSRDAEKIIKISNEGEDFLKTLNKNYLSPRGYYRILKVAQTIADVDDSEEVDVKHLAEAFSYRIKAEL